jgi:hypothetical protein
MSCLVATNAVGSGSLFAFFGVIVETGRDGMNRLQIKAAYRLVQGNGIIGELRVRACKYQWACPMRSTSKSFLQRFRIVVAFVAVTYTTDRQRRSGDTKSVVAEHKY